MTGTVKWFNDAKGFGFITGDDNVDVFVHYSEIEGMTGRKTLRDGARVTYDAADSDKGPKAINVRTI